MSTVKTKLIARKTAKAGRVWHALSWGTLEIKGHSTYPRKNRPFERSRALTDEPRYMAVDFGEVVTVRFFDKVERMLEVSSRPAAEPVRRRMLGELLASLPLPGVDIQPIAAGTLPGTGLPTAHLPK